MISEFIKKARELEEKATPAEWGSEVASYRANNKTYRIPKVSFYPLKSYSGRVKVSSAHAICVSQKRSHADCAENFEFIVFSRNNWKAVVDSLEEMRNCLEEISSKGCPCNEGLSRECLMKIERRFQGEKIK